MARYATGTAIEVQPPARIDDLYIKSFTASCPGCTTHLQTTDSQCKESNVGHLARGKGENAACTDSAANSHNEWIHYVNS